jgi:hypothetical protein
MRIILSAIVVALLLGPGGVRTQPGGAGKGKLTRDIPESSPNSSTRPLPSGPKTFGGKTLEQWKREATHHDASRRAMAIIAITTFGDEAKSAVPLLIGRIKDPDLSPRGKAILALRIIAVDDQDVPRVVEALATRLSRNPYSQQLIESQAIIRYEAAVSLRRFADDAAPAIPALINGAHDLSCWEIRHMCVSILWRAAMGNNKLPKPPKPPEPKKSNPPSKTRPGKSRNSERSTTPTLVAPADPRATVIKALLAVMGRPNETYHTRMEAVHGLGALGRPSDPALLRAEIEQLEKYARTTSSENKPLAIWSYASLVALGDDNKGDEALVAIAKFLKPDHKLEHRAEAAQALGALGKRAKKRIPSLVAMLDDKEAVAVSGACTALTQIGDSSDKVVTALVRVAQHKDPFRAAPAIIALVNLKANTPAVLDALEKVRVNKDTHKNLLPLVKEAIDELKKAKKADVPKKAVVPKNPKKAVRK